MATESIFTKAAEWRHELEANKQMEKLATEAKYRTEIRPVIDALEKQMLESESGQKFLKLVESTRAFLTSTTPTPSITEKQLFTFDFDPNSDEGKRAIVEWFTTNSQVEEEIKREIEAKGNLFQIRYGVALMSNEWNVFFKYEKTTDKMWVAMGRMYPHYSKRKARLTTDTVITKRAPGDAAFFEFVEEIISSLNLGLHKPGGYSFDDVIFKGPGF